jgi:hypothetical protein
MEREREREGGRGGKEIRKEDVWFLIQNKSKMSSGTFMGCI